MRALGLDPSLRSYGWVIYDDEATGIDRIVASGHPGTLSTTVPVARYVHFRSIVQDIIGRFKIDLVGLESPAYGGGEFSERHFGLMMYSSEAVFQARKDFILYDPSTLKYLATGSNRAQKADMIRQAQLELKTTRSLQADVVDAYHVAKFATRFHKVREGLLKPDDLSDFERKVFLLRSKKRKTKFGTQIKRTAHIFRENNRYFMFSKVPVEETALPEKDKIDADLVKWIETF